LPAAISELDFREGRGKEDWGKERKRKGGYEGKIKGRGGKGDRNRPI